MQTPGDGSEHPVARLAGAARRVNRAVRITDPDDATIAEAVALLDRATELLETAVHPGPHCQVGFDQYLFDGEVPPHDFFPYSPVVGPRNPLAPPVELHIEEDRRITGTVTLHEGYNGPPWNLAHGGVIALIFDELLGVAGIAATGGGFTAQLTINYRKPTPILVPLQLSARLDSIEGRKLVCKGEIRHDGVVTADAAGLFIKVGGPLKPEEGAPSPVLPAGGA